MNFISICGHHFVEEFSNDNFVVLDIGANKGEFTLQLKNRQQNGTYFLVEPNPDLTKNITNYNNLYIYNYAISDSDGCQILNLSNNPEASSLYHLAKSNSYSEKTENKVKVRTLTLNSLLELIDDPIIDLVKMDIEGAEVDALSNLDDNDSKRIKQLTVEFHSDPRFGFDLKKRTEEIINKMVDLDFWFIDFSRPHLMDVLFLNKKYYDISMLEDLYLQMRYEYLPYYIHRILYRIGIRSCNRR